MIIARFDSARTFSDSIVVFVLHHLRIISLDIWRPAM